MDIHDIEVFLEAVYLFHTANVGIHCPANPFCHQVRHQGFVDALTIIRLIRLRILRYYYCILSKDGNTKNGKLLK